MENKKAGIFFFTIIALIVGAGLFKQFNFETLQFKKIGLGIVYLITFIVSVYFLIKNLKTK